MHQHARHTLTNLFNLILDHLGPLCIIQGAQRLVKIVVGRTQSSEHECAAVPPQTLLQQPRQLAVPIGHVLFAALRLLPEGVDDVSEGHQTLVDGRAFLQRGSSRSGLVGSFAAREINQVDLTRQ